MFELKEKPRGGVGDGRRMTPFATARDVLKVFNNFVSSHNQIQRFAVVEELPRTPLGKIALQRLPEAFAEFEIKKQAKGKKA